MKNLFLMLIIIPIYLYPQQDVLEGNTWYLEKLKINNVEHFLPINPPGLNHIQLLMTAPNSNYWNSTVYNYIYFNYDHLIGSNVFTTSGYQISLAMSPWQNFEDLYFANFFMHNWSIANANPFSYIINVASNYKQLIITNNQGNKAYYYSQNLNVSQVEGNKPIIYISNDELVLNGIDNIQTIEIFNQLGKKIISFSGNEIYNNKNVNFLNINELYFVNILFTAGQKANYKIIKMK